MAELGERHSGLQPHPASTTRNEHGRVAPRARHAVGAAFGMHAATLEGGLAGSQRLVSPLVGCSVDNDSTD
jgi:hypothetical protein